MSDVIYLRGQGGAVFEFTPPLHREIQKQFNSRQLTRVNADGSEYEGRPGDFMPDPEGDDEGDEGDEGDGDAPAPRRGRGSKAAS